MSDKYNIVLTGVGGQGLMLLSSVFGAVCTGLDKPIITGEQHGLSQRSGSISVHVRMGTDALSPLIPPGCADVIIAMEATEALRYIGFLREGGTVIMSDRVIHPPLETAHLVQEGDAGKGYFSLSEILARIRKATSSVVVLDALALAEQSGNARAENVVLLGAACGLEGFPLPADMTRTAVASIVPPKTVEANLSAFDKGYDACCTTLG